MVGLGTRWNNTYRILKLRNGPGAAILPPSLTRIHLTFAHDIAGHIGPKKFWKECIRRLKFHNPGIPMIINRTSDEKTPATLRLYFRNESATKPADAPEGPFQPPSSLMGESPPQPPMWNERVVEIDVKGMQESAILEKVMSETGAEALETPQADEEALAKFAKIDEKAEKQSQAARKILEEERKAQAMLQRARAGAEA